MKELREATLLILLVFLFWTSTLLAADPIWEYIYEGDVLPDDASLGNDAWQLEGDNAFAEVTDQGELHIDDVGANHCFFLYNITDAALMQEATIEARVKVLSQSGSANFEVLVGMQDGSNSKWLDLFPDRILLDNTNHTYNVDMTEYHILRMVRDAGDIHIYVDDEQVLSESHVGAGESWIGFIFGAGCTSCTSEQYWDYLVFTTEGAFSPDELPSYASMLETGFAGDPIPASAANDVLRDVSLSWTPGEFAVKHDVYLGTSFEDVNNAESGTLVSQGQTDTEYTPDSLLQFGQTYYWRVDEVNGAPDHAVFRGSVWQFTVEPFAYPLLPTAVSASSSHEADMGPEKTIDGSGMDELDQHSIMATDMWLSGMGDPEPTIQYEFDKAYKLHQLLVWNSNQVIEAFVGIGAKDVVIEHSLDGIDWLVLEGATQFAQAPGAPNYTSNTVIDFDGVMAKYVKITINGGWGMVPQYGLSELRFLYTPTFAREPEPVDGSTTASATVELAWRGGREAASHEVLLGTNANDLALVDTTTEASTNLRALNYATTYFWQVVEVNDAEAPASYAGPVWSFTTPAYGIVDGFDQYDDDCNRIFFAWLDGLGHNGGDDIDDCDVAPYNGNGTGSIVGNASSPFAEKTIVHSGSQSMPLAYDSAVSETSIALDAQDWTASGVQSLSLYFYGAQDNTGQLYVKINNSMVAYDGPPNDLQRAVWTPWNIDLSSVAGNLQAVTSLTIGIQDASTQGMIYVDDIRLYPQIGETITPVMPDTANLVAYYPLDGDYQDASGNNRHGTAVTVGDGPIFMPGITGQALNLNVAGQYVEITGYQGIVADRSDPDNPVQQPFTVACWINTMDNGSLICWGSSDGSGVGGQYQNFRIDGGRLRAEHGNGRFRGAATVNDGEWHHVAMAVEAGSNMYPPGTGIFVDGLQDSQGADTVNAQNIWNITADANVSIGQRASHGDRFFTGSLDDVRIYDRALSAAEIAGLAGREGLIHRPL